MPWEDKSVVFKLRLCCLGCKGWLHTMCTGAANWTQYVIKDVRREQEIGSGVVGTGGMVRDGYDKNTLYLSVKFLTFKNMLIK